MIPALHALIDLLFPRHCPGCWRILPREASLLCWVCSQKLVLTQHFSGRHNELHRAFYGRYHLPFAASMLYYQKGDLVQELVHLIKYKGRIDLAQYFGRMCGYFLVESGLRQTWDAVVPVPMHPKRLKKRGYNQVVPFAKALSEAIGVPFRPEFLQKRLYTTSQTSKSRAERINLQDQVFQLGPTPPTTGQHILLVDDVFTTGATVEACLRVLHQIPQLQVSVITLACAQN